MSMLAGCAKPAPEEESTFAWKLQSGYGPGDQTWDVQMPIIVDAIQTASNGRITIETFIPGAICEPEQAPISVANGLLECAISAPGDTGQFVPAAYAEQGIPFFWLNGQDVYDNFYDYGMLDFLRTEYAKAGLYYGMYVPNGAYGFMTTFPINSIDDLKGKKIRASSSYGEFVNQLGAAPVTMPGGDIYMGLKLGTIDGCVYTLGELGPGKLMEVATDVMVQPAAGSAPVNFIIGQKAWDALPADLQEAVNKALQDSFMKIYDASVAVDVKSFDDAKAYGVVFTEVSPENMVAFYDAGLRTADFVIAKSPEAAQGIELIKAWKEAQ
jgi:TRAP-type C4-dicarboxylate transport system substrate-binding protein